MMTSFYRTMKDQSKVFNDAVHGLIELDYYCIKIIDTPIYQRLRRIRQLGACNFVFPGATHSRFEHSLGVCHLASLFLESLSKNYPISESDKKCVKIAALCHDLGHGPMSHMFDRQFLQIHGLTHEMMSTRMFDALTQDLAARGMIGQEDQPPGAGTGAGTAHNQRILTWDECTFIKELIRPETARPEGPIKTKHFLFEIVANDDCGIDVDKWDYLARDCHHLGITNSFDHLRLIKYSKILHCQADGLSHICFKDKEYCNINDMFYTRALLHHKAYQHPVCTSIELMITDLLGYMNNYMRFRSELSTNGLTLSECYKDAKAYAHLTDDIIYRIESDISIESNDKSHSKANNILQRIYNRKLYRIVASTQNISTNYTNKEIDRFEDIFHALGEGKFDREDFNLKVCKINFGQSNNDPMTNVKFFNKEQPNVVFDASDIIKYVSVLRTQTFEENYIRCYSKNSKCDDVIKQTFNEKLKPMLTKIK